MAASPADDLPPQTRAAFAALREKFRVGLPARWNEIEQAGDPAALCAALHRLAGAAGSYGFDDIGRAARTAEQLASEDRCAALDSAIEALRIALQAAARP